MGQYMDTPEGNAAGDVFYNISFGKEPFYKHQSWLSGRVTTDDNFTFYEKPELDENAPEVLDALCIDEILTNDVYWLHQPRNGGKGRKI